MFLRGSFHGHLFFVERENFIIIIFYKEWPDDDVSALFFDSDSLLLLDGWSTEKKKLPRFFPQVLLVYKKIHVLLLT